MKTKVLLAAAMLLLLSAGGALAGGKHKKYTCDDCSPDCLKNPYGKGCPSICRSPECQEASCDSCSPECKKNPGAAGCPEICKDVKCQSCSDCTPECKKNPAAPACPDICKDIKCYTCDDCTADCIINPSGPGCPSVCADLGCNVCDKFPKDCPASCKDNPDDPAKCPVACKGVPEQCIAAKQVTCDDCPPSCNDNPEQCPQACKELNCHPKPEAQAGPLRFVGDIGYFGQTTASAGYVFGRIGAEWSPFDAGSTFSNISFLPMLGISAQVGGDDLDGDDALLLDLLAHYNWKAGDVDGWIGLGVGGWITSGDVDNNAGDTNIDLIANVGARVYGDPKAFNASLFLELRSAVGEFDGFGIAEYSRFGGGLRLKF